MDATAGLFRIESRDTARLLPCVWCEDAFPANYTDAWWDPADDLPIHGRCVTERAARNSVVGRIARIRSLMTEFDTVEDEITAANDAWDNDGGPAPSNDLYYGRDDLAVEIVRELPDILAVLIADPRYVA